MSDNDFDSVYQWIEKQIKRNNVFFYYYKSYEFYLKDNLEIIIRKSFYILFKIVKEKGIFFLVKVDNDNKEMIRKMNQLLLEMLKMVRQDYNG